MALAIASRPSTCLTAGHRRVGLLRARFQGAREQPKLTARTQSALLSAQARVRTRERKIAHAGLRVLAQQLRGAERHVGEIEEAAAEERALVRAVDRSRKLHAPKRAR
eukprot:64517-Pleurochrysis_carterae.AAC.5